MVQPLSQSNPLTLRGAYRDLIKKAKAEKHTLVNTEENKLAELVQEANNLHKEVEKPREQAVDSELFALVTESGAEYVRKLTLSGRKHTPDELLRRLKTKYVGALDNQEAPQHNSAAFNWYALGLDLATLLRPAPRLQQMLGPIEAQPKAKVVRAHRRVTVGAVIRPEEISAEALAHQEARETDQQMTEMWEVIRAAPNGVNLLELVLNHESFAETVENIFTLSFLVRDKRVSLHPDAANGVQVLPHLSNGRGDGRDPSMRIQFVMDYSMAEWEKWKQAVPRERCLIKSRSKVQSTEAINQAENSEREGQDQLDDSSNARRRQRIR